MGGEVKTSFFLLFTNLQELKFFSCGFQFLFLLFSISEAHLRALKKLAIQGWDTACQMIPIVMWGGHSCPPFYKIVMI